MDGLSENGSCVDPGWGMAFLSPAPQDGVQVRETRVGTATKSVVLALAFLALAACEEDGISISGICSARCAQIEECDGYAFDSEYGGSSGTCRQLCEDELNEYYDDYEPAECEKLSMELEQCRAELDCDELHEWTLDEIDGESTWTSAHCTDESSALRECETEQ
jgi:hypothetical protein